MERSHVILNDKNADTANNAMNVSSPFGFKPDVKTISTSKLQTMGPNNRGKHWKSKIAEGSAPEPWKATKEWADKRIKLEADFCDLLKSLNQVYILPWRRSTAPYRVIGNTNKVLFIELIIHHFKKTAILAIEDDERKGFLGITRVFVSSENRGAFDAGFIPSVDGTRCVRSAAQIKTLIKIWHTAGFVEQVLEGGALLYVFDQATFDRMRAQAQRADEKRRAGKSPPHVPPALASSESSAAEDAKTSAVPAAPLRLPPMMSPAAAFGVHSGRQACPPAPAPGALPWLGELVACGGAGPASAVWDGARGARAAPGLEALFDAAEAEAQGRAAREAGKRKLVCDAGDVVGCSEGVEVRKAARHAGPPEPPTHATAPSSQCVCDSDAGSGPGRLSVAEAAATTARALAEAAEARAAIADAEARVAAAEARTAAAEARAAAAEARAQQAEARAAAWEPTA